MHEYIEIVGAREHNLKNISLSLPKNSLVVLTGLSGSGKSTLAFDTLHKEGQRQYLESLGLASYNLTKARVDAIRGLSPSISVDQNLSNRSPRSTVGTATDVYTYLRALYARLGRRPCPVCGATLPLAFTGAAEPWDDEPGEGEVDVAPGSDNNIACPACGADVPELLMGHFSFNKAAGACPTCTGLGTVHRANLARLLDEERSVTAGGVLRWDQTYEVPRYSGTLRLAAAYYGFAFDPDLPIKQLGRVQRELLLYGVESPQFRRYFPAKEPPETVAKGRFEGVITGILRRYQEHARDQESREKMEQLLVAEVCPDCQGERLRPESRAVTVAGRNIVAIARLPLGELADWLVQLPATFTADEQAVATPVLSDLRDRIGRLLDVGVSYLTMERSTPTLSAGEAMRLRLASLLGSGLSGVLYVLDEPTIGLHPRDTSLLIAVLRRLRDLGNTVLVVEHDLEVVAAADYVVDMGPGAGRDGGQVVAAGTPAAVAGNPASLTGGYLAGRTPALRSQRRLGNGSHLTIVGAREHNLKGITVSLPLGTFIAVTGVSGSGKSTLVFDVLDRAARRHFQDAGPAPGLHEAVEGWEHLDRVVAIDQTPIGRSPRSNAATYTDAFAAIREAFASTPEARERRLTAAHFSFNVPGGRCERCEGAGVVTVGMHFLPEVRVRCPACHGRRYRKEVLAARYRRRDIAEALELTIAEALDLFADVPAAVSRLQLMADVGLGYLQLGQPATTLSGGEAQRVKLAKELGRKVSGRTLYLLDEPTTGLRPADTARLLAIVQRLVDTGGTVVLVEHNLDTIRAADWVFDLGPEGGEAGGRLLASGRPEDIARVPDSHTGASLRGAGQVRATDKRA